MYKTAIAGLFIIVLIAFYFNAHKNVNFEPNEKDIIINVQSSSSSSHILPKKETLRSESNENSNEEGDCSNHLDELSKNLEITNKLLNDPTPNEEEYYGNFFNEVKKRCGELCEYDKSRYIKNPYRDDFFDQVKAKVSCCNLYSNPIYDAPSVRWPPPSEIPKVLQKDYTLNGKISISKEYYSQRYSGAANALSNTWTISNIENWIAQSRADTLSGNYGVADCKNVKEAIRKAGFKGKHILVIGSETPWVESILLAEGVKKITTLEYGTLPNIHPQIFTTTPKDFNIKFLKGEIEPFDGAVSYSSLEHSGLGRYGDSLNPWGDILAAAKVWCVLKPGGYFLLGVPSHLTEDRLVWNAHRFYSKERWPLILSNFEITDFVDGKGTSFTQTVACARKPMDA